MSGLFGPRGVPGACQSGRMDDALNDVGERRLQHHQHDARVPPIKSGGRSERSATNAGTRSAVPFRRRQVRLYDSRIHPPPALEPFTDAWTVSVDNTHRTRFIAVSGKHGAGRVPIPEVGSSHAGGTPGTMAASRSTATLSSTPAWFVPVRSPERQGEQRCEWTQRPAAQSQCDVVRCVSTACRVTPSSQARARASTPSR